MTIAETTSAPTVAAAVEAVQPLGGGDPVPSVEVRTIDGVPRNLRVLVRGHLSVLIFYRGGWCPYCNTQLMGLKRIEDQLGDLGYKLFAISPDRPAKLAESVSQQGLGYALLSDSSAAAIKAFGLAFEVDAETIERYRGYGIDLEDASGKAHHLLPVPAVYVVDRDANIRFAYWNTDYTRRLDPEKIVAAAREARTR